MNGMCPISVRQVDEKVAQLNAALVVLSLLFFLFTPYRWFILLLSVDFFIRGFLDPSYSFYSAASKTVLRFFKIEPAMINAGPKIFAAKIGFAFCCMIALCYFFDCRIITLVVGSLFVLCAALEASCGFCVACKIYPFIYKR
jgi:hypothetical protein